MEDVGWAAGRQALTDPPSERCAISSPLFQREKVPTPFSNSRLAFIASSAARRHRVLWAGFSRSSPSLQVVAASLLYSALDAAALEAHVLSVEGAAATAPGRRDGRPGTVTDFRAHRGALPAGLPLPAQTRTPCGASWRGRAWRPSCATGPSCRGPRGRRTCPCQLVCDGPRTIAPSPKCGGTSNAARHGSRPRAF